MKNSSLQEIYSITLNPCNEISLPMTPGTVTIDLNDSYITNMSMTNIYTVSPNIGTITITDPTQYEFEFVEDWRNQFPDFKQVMDMCKEYPALEKVVENFKTIYEMVKDDYESKRKEDESK